MASIIRLKQQETSQALAGACCVFGVFDGLHRGHQALIAAAREDARRRGAQCVVITFDRDPDELFRADKLRKLMTNEDRLNALAESDVDCVVALQFDRDFASEEPERFLDLAFGQNTPASMHVGYDLRFGYRAKGTVEDLRTWGQEHGMDVYGHDLVEDGGAPITATRIRGLLAEGDIAQANLLLGRPFRLCGQVQRGRGEGADMGFRTANLSFDKTHQVLADGVYSAYALVDGVQYKAAVSMGVAPTFADTAKATCEVHILDFQGNLYGQTIAVDFIARRRPMIKFDDVNELIKTVMADIDWARESL